MNLKLDEIDLVAKEIYVTGKGDKFRTEVANQAGHSNVQTTLIYSNPSARQMKEKANRL